MMPRVTMDLDRRGPGLPVWSASAHRPTGISLSTVRRPEIGIARGSPVGAHETEAGQGELSFAPPEAFTGKASYETDQHSVAGIDPLASRASK